MNMSLNPVCFGVLLILLGSNLPARAQGNLQMNGFLPQQSTASAPEDAPYKDGTNYLNEGKWDAAAGKFDQVAALHGKQATNVSFASVPKHVHWDLGTPKEQKLFGVLLSE